MYPNKIGECSAAFEKVQARQVRSLILHQPFWKMLLKVLKMIANKLQLLQSLSDQAKITRHHFFRVM